MVLILRLSFIIWRMEIPYLADSRGLHWVNSVTVENKSYNIVKCSINIG